jgi:hypothetical protein
MNSHQAVRGTTLVLFLLLSASLMYAKSSQMVSAPCEKAIAQATVLAAHRKRSSLRPYPTAPVLNIESNRNFAKVYFFGTVWSHKKYGELAFDATGDASCSVISNGHPADVVLSDLVKVYGHPTLAGLGSTPGATQGSREARDYPGTLEPVVLRESSGTPKAATSIPALGLLVTTRDEGGVQIVALASGGTAERANMHVGYVINSVDGKAVGTPTELEVELQSRAPGTKIRLGYMFRSSALGSRTYFSNEAVLLLPQR